MWVIQDAATLSKDAMMNNLEFCFRQEHPLHLRSQLKMVAHPHLLLVRYLHA